MKYLENIFSKAFKNVNVVSHDDDWFDIDMKLSRKNFLRFGFSNFNIYYSFLIIIAFIASTGTGIHYFYNKTNQKQPVESSDEQMINMYGIEAGSLQQKDSINITDTIYLRRIVYDYDTVYVDTGDENNIHKVKGKYFKDKADKEIIKESSFKYDSIETASSKLPVSPGIIDKTVSDDSEVHENNEPVIKKINKAVIIYEDDIILRDTIVQYRKRKHK